MSNQVPPLGASPPTAPSAAVQREWLRRLEAEYRSAAITSSLSHWLIQIAAPVRLIDMALAIVGDELAHAELSAAVYAAAGGQQVPVLPRESLGLPPATSAIELSVLHHGTEVFCLGETIAVRLFGRMRAGCDVPPARAALDRILVDEVRHRDFGWTLLEWLLSLPQASEFRDSLHRVLPVMMERLYKRYGNGSPSLQPLSEDDRRWGLMPAAVYAEVLESTIKRDYRPLFAELDITLPASR